MILVSIEHTKTSSGIARWNGDTLLSTTVMRYVELTGWLLGSSRVRRAAAMADESSLWPDVLFGCDAVVLSVPPGRESCVRALCQSQGAKYFEMQDWSWRQVIADEMRERGEPITWSIGNAAKSQAMTAVRRLYGRVIGGSDEANAVLIGRAALSFWRPA